MLKASALNTTPSGGLRFRGLPGEDFLAMDAAPCMGVALLVGFGGSLCSWNAVGSPVRPSTESLILAQDERWRRA